MHAKMLPNLMADIQFVALPASISDANLLAFPVAGLCRPYT